MKSYFFTTSNVIHSYICPHKCTEREEWQAERDGLIYIQSYDDVARRTQIYNLTTSHNELVYQPLSACDTIV